MNLTRASFLAVTDSQRRAIGYAATAQQCLTGLHSKAFWYGRNPRDAEATARRIAKTTGLTLFQAIAHVHRMVENGDDLDAHLA